MSETPSQAYQQRLFRRHPRLRHEGVQRHAHAGRIENPERITSTATGNTKHGNEHLTRTAWFVRNKREPPYPTKKLAVTEGFSRGDNSREGGGGHPRHAFSRIVKKNIDVDTYDVRGLRSQRATQGLARASEGTLDGLWRYI